MNIDALKELLAKVEADQIDLAHVEDAFDPEHWDNALGALNGDLNAAKALHDALLPGWDYRVSENDALVMQRYSAGRVRFQQAWTDGGARAWLIAILRALIAEAEA